MAQRVESFNVTAAAGGNAVPQITLSQQLNDVQQVDIYFPRGCRNLVTAQLLYGGTLVIPSANSNMPTGDGTTISVDLEDQPNGNGWQAVVVNTDAVYAHTIRYTFYINEVDMTAVGQSVVYLLPVGE